MDTLRCTDFQEKQKYHFAPMFPSQNPDPGVGVLWFDLKDGVKTFFYQHPEDSTPTIWKPCRLSHFVPAQLSE